LLILVVGNNRILNEKNLFETVSLTHPLLVTVLLHDKEDSVSFAVTNDKYIGGEKSVNTQPI